MKVKIIACGKLKDKNIISLIAEYKKRIPWDISIEEVEVKSKPDSPALLKSQEEALILGKIPDGYFVASLNEIGLEMDSPKFAGFIEKKFTDFGGRICLIIGGSEGLSDKIKSSYSSVSLGKLTYPHMLARLLLIEQLYRAYTIMAGKKYHK